MALTVPLAPRAWADSTASTPHVQASAPAEPERHAVGFRVGGYGFRSTDPGQHHGAWDDCRMDGTGIFAQRQLTEHFFAEAGFDLYQAADVSGDPGSMDRLSGVATLAGGVRMRPAKRISPYLQLGAGLEATKVRVYGTEERTSGVFPMGFFGLGVDVRVAQRFSLGANLRTNVMAHFPHTDMPSEGPVLSPIDGEGDGQESGHMHTIDDNDFEVAAQGQLFVKYAF